jgi:Lrp/AsnC family transcriptional regulator, regulator for asnA, asnC and gidA
MSAQLSQKDIKILNELQVDSKQSYNQISEKIGIPSSTIFDRVSKMMQSGLVKQFTAMLDYELLQGTMTAIIGVETGAELYHDVAVHLSQFDEVLEVYGTTAQYDLMVKVKTFSRKQLVDKVNLIRQIRGVNDINVMSVLEVFKEEHALPVRLLLETEEDHS